MREQVSSRRQQWPHEQPDNGLPGTAEGECWPGEKSSSATWPSVMPAVGTANMAPSALQQGCLQAPHMLHLVAEAMTAACTADVHALLKLNCTA